MIDTGLASMRGSREPGDFKPDTLDCYLTMLDWFRGANLELRSIWILAFEHHTTTMTTTIVPVKPDPREARVYGSSTKTFHSPFGCFRHTAT
jgi:hypothetical protein